MYAPKIILICVDRILKSFVLNKKINIKTDAKHIKIIKNICPINGIVVKIPSAAPKIILNKPDCFKIVVFIDYSLYGRLQ